MQKYFMKLVAAAMALATISAPALAEVVSSSSSHYRLKHEAVSELSPAALWDRLVSPANWWRPDHTYSGDSANLSLDLQAGGLWREEWDGGSVVHGSVLYVKPGEVLRLNAPFGPLQGMGVITVWTITIKADGGGSRVIFDEVSNGSPASGLNDIAAAVDYVKQEAIQHLVATD